MPPKLRQRVAHAVAALMYRDFRLFYAGLMVAALGSQFQSTANMWQVYELTDSPLHLGLTGLARGIPVFAFSLVGGIMADRIDRLKFTLVVQATSGILSLVLAALTATGLIQVWHIYLVILVGSTLTSVNAPARSAIIPNLVPKEHLLNALALNSTVWQMSQLLGPALAGVSIALFGLPTAYMVNGLAHLVTVIALAAIHLGPVVGRSRQSALKSLMEGLSFVRAQSIILVLLAMDSAAVFFGSYRALLPVFARSLGVGAYGMGLLMSAPAAGALLGAALIMVLGNVRYKGLFVIGGIIAYCSSLVVLAVSPWFSLSLVMTAALGFFDSLQANPRNAVIQTITPDELRGRVFSFHGMLTSGAPSLGQLQSGAIATLVGAPLTLIVGATACTIVILGIAILRRDLRAADL